MRRPTPAEAHRARTALIEGEYPEGMQGRCSLCGRRTPIAEGRMVAADPRATAPTKVFVCARCLARLTGPQAA